MQYGFEIRLASFSCGLMLAFCSFAQVGGPVPAGGRGSFGVGSVQDGGSITGGHAAPMLGSGADRLGSAQRWVTFPDPEVPIRSELRPRKAQGGQSDMPDPGTRGSVDPGGPRPTGGAVKREKPEFCIQMMPDPGLRGTAADPCRDEDPKPSPEPLSQAPKSGLGRSFNPSEQGK